MLMFRSGGITKFFRAKPALLTLALLTGVPGSSAVAQDDLFLDGSAILERNVASGIRFASPLEAYRQGKSAFEEGWYGLALPALRHAADEGVFGARLMLAKMYEFGLGVPRNDARAYKLYKQLSSKNWNISTYHPAAPHIGQSLAALGHYYLNGIEAIGMKPDARRAARHFTHAAQFFGDPRAQHELAKMYLTGQGVKKNVRRAVGWLNNATKKKYAPSQALLGQILWEGTLVPKRQIKALALLTMAQENAGAQDSEWISELYKAIVADSEPKVRRRAKAVVARWVRIFRPKNGKGRIIIQKEVRIGIAERPASQQRRKPQVREQTVRNQSAKPRSGVERDLWMGVGNFRQINPER